MIFDGAQRDFAIAAFDENVGDGLGNVRPFGNRQQMLLTFGPGGFHQRDVFEPGRLFEHGTGDRYRLVEGKLADNTGRRIHDRREPLCQRLASRQLYVRNQMVEDTVEQGDMIGRKMRGAEDEQIGDAAERLRPTIGGAMGQRLFEFVEDGILAHRVAPFRLEGDVDADLGKDFR